MLFSLVLIFLLLPMSLCAMEQSLSPKILSPGSKIISPGKLVYTNPDFDATTESYLTILTPSKKSKTSPLSPAKRPLELLSGSEKERSSKAVQLKRSLFELSNKLKGNQSPVCQPHVFSLEGCDKELMNYYYYSLKAESLLNGLVRAIEGRQLSQTLNHSRELNKLMQILESEQHNLRGGSDLRCYIQHEMDQCLADEPDHEEFALNTMSSVIELELPQQQKLPVQLTEENFSAEDKDFKDIMSKISPYKRVVDYYLTVRPFLKDLDQSIKTIQIDRGINSDLALLDFLKSMRSEEKSLDADSLHAMHILQEHIEKKMEASLYTKPHPNALLLKMKELELRHKRARKD